MTADSPPHQPPARQAERIGVGTILSSLRGNRPFQQLWLSNLFFFGGVWTQTLVLGWMAFDMTHSEFLLAVFTAVRLAPLLFGPLAGAVADRHNRVSLLLLACGWATVAMAAVAGLASFGMLPYGALVAAGLAIGLAQSPSQPARSSLVVDLVGVRRVSNANALNSLAVNMTQVIGPGIGGVMIAGLGAPAALWVSTAWYAASFVLVLPLRRARIAVHPATGSVVAMVGGGIRIVARNRRAVAVLLITLSANVFVWPVYQSFMPVFAEEGFGLDAAGLGALLTCAGVGGLVGSVVIAALGDFRGKGALFVFGTLAWSALWVVFSQLHVAAAGFTFMALIGLGSAAFGVLQTTLLLVVTGPRVHGRVLGLQELAIGVMPLTTLGLGAVAQQIGVGATTMYAAIAMIVVVLALMAAVPEVLRIGRSDEPETLTDGPPAGKVSA